MGTVISLIAIVVLIGVVGDVLAMTDVSYLWIAVDWSPLLIPWPLIYLSGQVVHFWVIRRSRLACHDFVIV